MQGLQGFVGPIANESRSVDPATENGLLLTTESKITWIRHNREPMLQFCEITQESLKFFEKLLCWINVPNHPTYNGVPCTIMVMSLSTQMQ